MVNQEIVSLMKPLVNRFPIPPSISIQESTLVAPVIEFQWDKT